MFRASRKLLVFELTYGVAVLSVYEHKTLSCEITFTSEATKIQGRQLWPKTRVIFCQSSCRRVHCACERTARLIPEVSVYTLLNNTWVSAENSIAVEHYSSIPSRSHRRYESTFDFTWRFGRKNQVAGPIGRALLIDRSTRSMTTCDLSGVEF